MPSVRIKRERGYSTLQDIPDIPEDGQPQLRPRSRSFAGLFAPATPQPPNPDVPLTLQADHGRRRGSTFSNQLLPEQRGSATLSPPTSPRPPGRVSSMVMRKEKAQAAASADDRDDRSEVQVASSLSRVRGSVSSRGQRSRAPSMVSYEGAHETVRIPTDEGHEPGRIGSALSFRDNDDDDDREDFFDEENHHHDDIVEHLDVIDPQIATVSMLTNAANSMVFPPLSFYSRKPVIVLPSVQPRPQTALDIEKGNPVYEDNLDRHVEEVLRKRDKFRRTMRGVWSFLKTPMGILVGIYGFLIVFWGAGIVLFLAKMINLHNDITQGFWVELCQQIETGLFTVTSIGLIPFRSLDTYRVYKIWYYKRRTRKLREKAGLPQLYDVDDLPDPVYDENYVHVLSEREQADLHYQQFKFSQSQTWYRPHGTQTHRAFPINLALTITILNDLNSFFQILLSACMWSMDRFQRPAWTTATTLPAAFVAGIAAGVYIWWGGRKTKRTAAVEKRLRTALAMDSPATAVGSNPAIKITDDDGVSVPTTAGSTPMMKTPAMNVNGRTPQTHDFAQSTSTVVASPSPDASDPKYKEKGLSPVPHSPIPESPTTSSSAPYTPRADSMMSIPISDAMTVPPAAKLHNGVKMR
ncbi:hypothetical protein EIP91_011376 [Steccherinum ochraceum]|uniref:Uncharacterized protein n=1 Tax=Steccherinum ochraceum TaxID=92696 RepID=A0A4R0RYJ2_9APHY|nr:hypothetical protein EIP91_011376 [Steccherinum ochraceum]